MDRKQILLALDEIVEVPPGTLQGTESVKDWDSIIVIGLIAFADENFNKSLTANDIATTETVDDIVNLLMN